MLALLAATLASGVPAAPSQDAREREFAVRRLALAFGNGDRPQDLPEAPDASPGAPWTDRHAWLEALARAERWPAVEAGADGTDPTAAAVLRALADPQPNLRAAALAVLAAHPGQLPLDVAPWLDDPLPEVRLRTVALASPDQLAHLCADPDPEVASEALRWLVSAGPGAADAQARVLRADPQALAGALDALERHGASPRLATALAAGSGPHADLVDLCGWIAADPDVAPAASRVAEALVTHSHDLDVLAVCRRRARRGDMDLGLALLDRARHAGPLDAGRLPPDWFEVGVLALGPSRAAQEGLDLEGAWATDLWRVLAAQAHPWRARELAPWLDPSHSDTVRFDVAQVVAAQLEREPDGGVDLARLLLPCVVDRSPGLRIAAFRWLARSPFLGAVEPELHDAWSRLDGEARLQRLQDLPRGKALHAFRDDLLALARVRGTRTPSVVELLSTFGPEDREVHDVLGAALELELARVSGEREGTEALQAAAQLARTLGLGYPDASVELLERALQANLARPGRPRWDLLKAAVDGLDRSASGRQRLASLMGDADLALRARYEAALHRCADPSARALLLGARAEVDGVLRERALGALSSVVGDDAALDDALAAVVLDPGADLLERVAAVEALGRRGRSVTLVRALPRLEDGELRLVLARSLARVGDPAGLEPLVAHARALLRRRDEPLEGEWYLEEALQVLAAAASLGGLPADLRDEALARPLARARDDLEQRYRDRNPGAPEARFRAELELLRALAARGEARAVFTDERPWWSLDARVLHAASEAVRAGGDADLAGHLLSAARIALQGEPRRGRDAQLRLRWLAAGPGDGDPQLVEARLASGLRVADRGLLGRLDRGE